MQISFIIPYHELIHELQRSICSVLIWEYLFMHVFSCLCFLCFSSNTTAFGKHGLLSWLPFELQVLKYGDFLFNVRFWRNAGVRLTLALWERGSGIYSFLHMPWSPYLGDLTAFPCPTLQSSAKCVMMPSCPERFLFNSRNLKFILSCVGKRGRKRVFICVCLCVVSSVWA